MKKILIALFLLLFPANCVYAADNVATIQLYSNGADNAYLTQYQFRVKIDDKEKYPQPKIQNTIYWQKDGHIVSSWNSKRDGTGKKVTFKYKDTNYYTSSYFRDIQGEPKALYAQYTPCDVRIRYEGNGATSGSMEDEYTSIDQKYQLRENCFKKTGYTFKGWKYENDMIIADAGKINEFTYPNNTIHPDNIITLDPGLTAAKSHYSTQGAAVWKEGNTTYAIVAYVNTSATSAEGQSWLVKYNLDTGKLIKSVQHKANTHLNDICYNPDDGLFYTSCRYIYDKNLNLVGRYNRLGPDGKQVSSTMITYKDGEYFVKSGDKYYKFDKNWKYTGVQGSLTDAKWEDFSVDSAPGGQGADIDKNGTVFTAMFIGSTCNNYIATINSNNPAETHRYAYHSAHETKNNREVEDFYITDDKIYVFTGSGTGCPTKGKTYVQTFNEIPTNRLVAQWEPIKYTVRLHDGTGKVTEQTLTYDKVEKLTEFTRAGYILKGWSTSETGNVVYGNEVKNLTDDPKDVIDLYAVWDVYFKGWYTINAASTPCFMLTMDNNDLKTKLATKAPSQKFMINSLQNGNIKIKTGLSAGTRYLAGTEESKTFAEWTAEPASDGQGFYLKYEGKYLSKNLTLVDGPPSKQTEWKIMTYKK